MYIVSMVVVHIHTRRKCWMIYRVPGFLAVVWFGSSPTLFPLSRQQVVSLSPSSYVSPVEPTHWGGGGMWWGRSQIIRRRESLVLYKSFNTLCTHGSNWFYTCLPVVPGACVNCFNFSFRRMQGFWSEFTVMLLLAGLFKLKGTVQSEKTGVESGANCTVLILHTIDDDFRRIWRALVI